MVLYGLPRLPRAYCRSTVTSAATVWETLLPSKVTVFSVADESSTHNISAKVWPTN